MASGGSSRQVPSGRRRVPSHPRVKRAPLGREAIADAALALIDEGGVDALSMRRVAERLGTGPASLYAHVSGREDLLDLVQDRVSAELHVPDPDPDRWDEQLLEVMHAQREVYRSHRDVARIAMGRVPVGPNTLPVIERFVALLRAADLPERLVGLAPDLVALYVTAVTLEETYYDPATKPEDVERWVGELRDLFESLPRDEFPNLAAAADALTGADGDERFSFGAEVIVRGLKAMAEDGKV